MSILEATDCLLDLRLADNAHTKLTSPGSLGPISLSVRLSIHYRESLFHLLRWTLQIDFREAIVLLPR